MPKTTPAASLAIATTTPDKYDGFFILVESKKTQEMAYDAFHIITPGPIPSSRNVYTMASIRATLPSL